MSNDYILLFYVVDQNTFASTSVSLNPPLTAVVTSTTTSTSITSTADQSVALTADSAPSSASISSPPTRSSVSSGLASGTVASSNPQLQLQTAALNTPGIVPDITNLQLLSDLRRRTMTNFWSQSGIGPVSTINAASGMPPITQASLSQIYTAIGPLAASASTTTRTSNNAVYELAHHVSLTRGLTTTPENSLPPPILKTTAAPVTLPNWEMSCGVACSSGLVPFIREPVKPHSGEYKVLLELLPAHLFQVNKIERVVNNGESRFTFITSLFNVLITYNYYS